MKAETAQSEELMYSGHLGCPGCGASVAMKFALQALGPKTVVIIPASCWGVISGPFPQSALKVPIMQAAFASAGAMASGVRAGLDMQGDTETIVVAWAGDGGTYDIGIQSLSGAVERNEDFIYVCYDNEAYMNTGVQRSSATPYGMRTTTTPGKSWKKARKKNMLDIMAAHRIPYAASASIAFPEDMIAKFEKAREMRGKTRYLHLLAPCPAGWRTPSEMTIKIARLAVQTNVFPLYEIEDGVRYTLNSSGDRPVADYLKPQGRFSHLTRNDYKKIQAFVDADWNLLRQKIEKSA